MKIILSENRILSEGSDARRTVHHPDAERVFSELIWATTPLEFKQMNISLREIVRLDSRKEFLCFHPEWFDEEGDEQVEIDGTVCNFCGYREQCEYSLTDASVEVLGVQFGEKTSHPLTPEQFSKSIKNCFRGQDRKKSSIVIDPFVGFSPQANTSRDLYFVRYSVMRDNFRDFESNTVLNAAIGYDLQSAQSIWPSDIRILQMIMNPQICQKYELQIQNISKKRKQISQHDELTLRQIGNRRGWYEGDDPESFHQHIKEMFSHIIGCLREISGFHSIAMTPMKPFVDHPFSVSGSGWLNTAVRIFELHPYTLQLYLDNHLGIDELLFVRMKEIYHERRGAKAVSTDVGERRRFIPRFPAILIYPPNSLEQVQLELPSCRIIEVREGQVTEPCLLIDTLEFDLSNLQGWSLA